MMVRRGVPVEDLAAECEVDPKTVERWISSGRVPHRRHRWVAARRLGAEEAYLWPQIAEVNDRRPEASRAELIEVFPDRASVPRDVWLRLLGEARERVDVLVLAGAFLSQVQPRIGRVLADRAGAGVRVRLCFADPSGEAVAVRDREDCLVGTLGAIVRSSLTHYRGLVGVEGCEVRLHAVTHHASVLRFDDEVVVTPHVFGESGNASPTFHFRRVQGGNLFDHYVAGLDRVWDSASPWSGEVG
ncbi:hypothetical protein EDC02_3468 [Micromonospora sp. Llam0]|nr:hypothetical protein EDC02_3468 [Micromonospora sp. Llam0]